MLSVVEPVILLWAGVPSCVIFGSSFWLLEYYPVITFGQLLWQGIWTRTKIYEKIVLCPVDLIVISSSTIVIDLCKFLDSHCYQHNWFLCSFPGKQWLDVSLNILMMEKMMIWHIRRLRDRVKVLFYFSTIECRGKRRPQMKRVIRELLASRKSLIWCFITRTLECTQLNWL